MFYHSAMHFSSSHQRSFFLQQILINSDSKLVKLEKARGCCMLISKCLTPFSQNLGIIKEKRLKDWIKRWMTNRNWLLPDLAGQLHIWTQNSCPSILRPMKIQAGQNPRKEAERRRKFHSLGSISKLQLLGEWESVFFKGLPLVGQL